MSGNTRILMVRETGLSQAHHVVRLCNFLSASGYSLSVVITGPGDPSHPDLAPAVDVVPLAPGGRGKPGLRDRILGALRLQSQLRRRVFDLLYVVDSWTLFTVWLATLGRFRWGRRPLIYHTFDWLEPALVASAHIYLEKSVCRRADLVVNTDRARARLQRTLYGLSRTPLWVQNSLSSAVPMPVADPLSRRELMGGRDPGDAFLVIYPNIVSDAASAQKMTYELIRAFSILPDRYHLAAFFSEGVEYRRCAERVAKDGLQERVVFLPRVPFGRLMTYIASADVGAIFYDDRESSGYFMCNPDKLSVMAACGTPFVASDYPNLEALTYKHGLGVCCDARDPAQIAAAIRSLGEEGVSEERRRRIRRAFEASLCLEVQGVKLREALDQVLAAGRR